MRAITDAMSEGHVRGAVLYDHAISFLTTGSIYSNFSIDEALKLLDRDLKYELFDSPEREFLEACQKYLKRITNE